MVAEWEAVGEKGGGGEIHGDRRRLDFSFKHPLEYIHLL